MACREWRPFVVFGFGLLHGIGFASILTDVGLPQGAFFPALIGFNIGVELGQLAIIAVAFGLVGYWFGPKAWYRRAIAIPASLAIAAMGAWWFVERDVSVGQGTGQRPPLAVRRGHFTGRGGPLRGRNPGPVHRLGATLKSPARGSKPEKG